MFRAGTERGPQRAPQGFKPRYAVVQPESPSPHRRWAVPGARGRACACIGSVGFLSLLKGDFTRAIAALERGVGICQARNISYLVPFTTSALGYAYALSGRVMEAVPLLE